MPPACFRNMTPNHNPSPPTPRTDQHMAVFLCPAFFHKLQLVVTALPLWCAAASETFNDFHGGCLCASWLMWETQHWSRASTDCLRASCCGAIFSEATGLARARLLWVGEIMPTAQELGSLIKRGCRGKGGCSLDEGSCSLDRRRCTIPRCHAASRQVTDDMRSVHQMCT